MSDKPWNPEVERIRKAMMERFSDKLSMEEIAEFAYSVAVESRAPAPQLTGEDLAPTIWKADEEWHRLQEHDQMDALADWGEWIGSYVLAFLAKRAAATPQVTPRKCLGYPGCEGDSTGLNPCPLCPERRATPQVTPTKPTITLEVYQHDWLPGFAAFHSDGERTEGATKHIVLNLGSLLCAVESGDLPKQDLPYMIAESLMHETVHALEEWAGVEFSEERVEELLTKYRAKYARATIWEYTGSKPKESAAGTSEQAPQVTPELELEQEADGRWLAEFTRFPGVAAYGPLKEQAIWNAAKVLIESEPAPPDLLATIERLANHGSVDDYTVAGIRAELRDALHNFTSEQASPKCTCHTFAVHKDCPIHGVHFELREGLGDAIAKNPLQPTPEPASPAPEEFPSRSQEKRIRTMRGERKPLDPRAPAECPTCKSKDRCTFLTPLCPDSWHSSPGTTKGTTKD